MRANLNNHKRRIMTWYLSLFTSQLFQERHLLSLSHKFGMNRSASGKTCRAPCTSAKNRAKSSKPVCLIKSGSKRYIRQMKAEGSWTSMPAAMPNAWLWTMFCFIQCPIPLLLTKNTSFSKGGKGWVDNQYWTTSARDSSWLEWMTAIPFWMGEIVT